MRSNIVAFQEKAKGMTTIVLGIFSLIAIPTLVSAQYQKDYALYNHNGKTEHIGITASLGFNTGIGMSDKRSGGSSAKPGHGALFVLGTYYQYSLTPKSYLRAGVDIGFNAHKYKYALYKAKSDTTWGTFEKPTKNVSMASPIIRLSLGFGKKFDIGYHHQIEANISGIAEKYLTNRTDEEWASEKSSTTLTNTDRTEYLISYRNYWGNQRWGSFNGEVYIGYRSRNHNAFSDRVGVGLFYYMNIGTTYLGYSDITFYENKYKYMVGEERMIRSNATIGIKLVYEFF